MEFYLDNEGAYSCLMYKKLCTNGERFATVLEVDMSIKDLATQLSEKGHKLNLAHYYSYNEFIDFLREYQKFVTFDEQKRTLSLTDIVNRDNIQNCFYMGALPFPIMEVVCNQIRDYQEQNKEDEICM